MQRTKKTRVTIETSSYGDRKPVERVRENAFYFGTEGGRDRPLFLSKEEKSHLRKRKGGRERAGEMQVEGERMPEGRRLRRMKSFFWG